MNAGRGNKRQERLAVRVVEFGHAVGRRPRLHRYSKLRPRRLLTVSPELLDAGTSFRHAARTRITGDMRDMMRTEIEIGLEPHHEIVRRPVTVCQ